MSGIIRMFVTSAAAGNKQKTSRAADGTHSVAESHSTKKLNNWPQKELEQDEGAPVYFHIRRRAEPKPLAGFSVSLTPQQVDA